MLPRTSLAVLVMVAACTEGGEPATGASSTGTGGTTATTGSGGAGGMTTSSSTHGGAGGGTWAPSTSPSCSSASRSTRPCLMGHACASEVQGVQAGATLQPGAAATGRERKRARLGGWGANTEGALLGDGQAWKASPVEVR